jgi:hypothetical protein
VSINTLIVDISHVWGAYVVNFVSNLLQFKLFTNNLMQGLCCFYWLVHCRYYMSISYSDASFA